MGMGGISSFKHLGLRYSTIYRSDSLIVDCVTRKEAGICNAGQLGKTNVPKQNRIDHGRELATGYEKFEQIDGSVAS